MSNFSGITIIALKVILVAEHAPILASEATYHSLIHFFQKSKSIILYWLQQNPQESTATRGTGGAASAVSPQMTSSVVAQSTAANQDTGGLNFNDLGALNAHINELVEDYSMESLMPTNAMYQGMTLTSGKHFLTERKNVYWKRFYLVQYLHFFYVIRV